MPAAGRRTAVRVSCCSPLARSCRIRSCFRLSRRLRTRRLVRTRGPSAVCVAAPMGHPGWAARRCVTAESTGRLGQGSTSSSRGGIVGWARHGVEGLLWAQQGSFGRGRRWGGRDEQEMGFQRRSGSGDVTNW